MDSFKLNSILYSFVFSFAIYTFLLSSLWIPAAISCPRKSNPSPSPPDKEGKIFIAVPKKLSLDTYEKIAVIAYEIPYSLSLEVSVKNFAFFSYHEIYRTTVLLENGIPRFVYIHLSSDKILQTFDKKSFDEDMFDKRRLYVVIEAKIGKIFHKKIKILVEKGNRYVLLQTDKPIYNPKQTVKIRVIPLNDKLLPDNFNVRVQIKNPQNVIVHENTFTKPWDETSNDEFPKIYFTFPPFTLLGKWSIVAFYGKNFQHNTSVTIHVEEYVLPTFAVKLRVPNVILSTDNTVNFTVLADYVYGKKVTGTASCNINFINENGDKVAIEVEDKAVNNGEAVFTLTLSEIFRITKSSRFPYGSKLSVKVSVTDVATDATENSEEVYVKLAKSPFLISLNRTLKYYKPGVVFVVMADITHLNGKPASNVPAVITVKDSNNREVEVSESRKISDENGRVIFYLSSFIDHIRNVESSQIEINVRTYDMRYKQEQQASAKHIIRKFFSNNFIVISRTESAKKVEIDQNFVASVFSSKRLDNIFFMVVARKKILLFKEISKGETHQRQLEFVVTDQMSPFFTVIIFSMEGNEVLVDSVRVFVEKKCNPKSEVEVKSDFPTVEPGSKGRFIINGESGTKVGLLAVDSAVYALKNQDKLTKEKLFNTIEKRYLSSKSGDGGNSDEILANSGLFVITQDGLVERSRTQNTSPVFTVMMTVNTQTFSETPSKDTNDFFDIIDPYDDDNFLDHDDIDEEMEEDTHVRSDFRETWLFDDVKIGSNGTVILDTRLPDSITTWVVQAVSVAPQWGICVTEPEEIISFQPIFLQLNIPYSVVRNEKLDIRATVFSYYAKKIPVTVHFYGVKDLLTEVKEGKRSERKRITIEALSTGTVHFSAVPLKAKEYFIRVVALSPLGADVVVRKLNVVAEGITEEENFVITLDPENQQRRTRRAITGGIITDIIDETKHFQTIRINFRPKRQFVDGTEMCAISAIGTEFGPTVETITVEPRHLIRKPDGCGEQTMMYMGPTLYTLQFLKSKGNIDIKTEEQLYDFVNEGYKRILTFRKKDGSYSIWPRSPSSVWVTSYVIKVFCQVSKLIFIDEYVTCSGINWIISNQNPDGSFEDLYPVLRRNIMYGSVGKIPMTAFVLSVLQECTSTCNDEAIRVSRWQAKSFLEYHYSSVTDSYVMALTAYALALTNSYMKYDANKLLLNMSSFNEGLNQRYWRNDDSTDIEITAYGLLTQMQLHDMSTSLSIINWMNRQRLYRGSFSSSQETVIALQALSQYLIGSKSNDIALDCNVTSSQDKNFVKRIHFKNDNALILQEYQANNCNETLVLNVSGKGVGLLSVKMKYNVPNVMEDVCKFDINVNVTEVNDLISSKNETNEKCNRKDYKEDNETSEHNLNEKLDCGLKEKLIMKMEICTRFRSSRNSQMTIIHSGIFSGFDPIIDDLEKLKNDMHNTVDRYEVEERNVIFYLDHVSYINPVCLTFRKRRNQVVKNIQSIVVKVYDYYNKDDYCTKLYRPEEKLFYSEVLMK